MKLITKSIILLFCIINTSCVYDLPTDYTLIEWHGDTKELGHIIVQFENSQIKIITDVTEPILSEYKMIAKDKIIINNAISETLPRIEFLQISDINDLSMILMWHYPDQCTPIRKELLISSIYYN